MIPQDLVRVGDLFYLVALEGSRNIHTEEDRPAVWTSPDGREWTRLAEDLRIAGGQAFVNDVCALPDGGVALVGGTQDDQERWFPATWTSRDGVWAGAALTDLGEGSLNSCTPREADVVVTGGAAGLDRTWSTADGATLTEEEVLDEGVERRAALAVGDEDRPAGWVAPGSLDIAEHVGPVLWFSADAREWEWLPLPGPTRTGTPAIALDGADLLVTASRDLAPRAWVIPDVASVF